MRVQAYHLGTAHHHLPYYCYLNQPVRMVLEGALYPANWSGGSSSSVAGVHWSVLPLVPIAIYPVMADRVATSATKRLQGATTRLLHRLRLPTPAALERSCIGGFVDKPVPLPTIGAGKDDSGRWFWQPASLWLGLRFGLLLRSFSPSSFFRPPLLGKRFAVGVTDQPDFFDKTLI
jgi:hypothetical protein